MKPTQTRRFRRRSTPSRTEGTFFKKESQQEQSFFGESSHDSFFQPVTTPAQSIQRKCAECEKEEKKVHRMEDKKEEDKKLHRQPEKKEEDKKLMRLEDKKDEEKIQKKEDKKEEEKLMKKEEKKEEENIQKKETGTVSVSSPGVSNYVSSLSSKGNPLPAQANHFFSSRMGFDFSNVKIHTDKEAAKSAKDVNAKAYTIGNNIVFNEGQYNIESGEGKKLMAHELAHVMQQVGSEKISKKGEEGTEEPIQKELLPLIHLEVEGSLTQNTRHNANCNGVSVSGSTDANYSNRSSMTGQPAMATSCAGCTGKDCITISGNIVSVFRTAPVVTLPSVPGGLNQCEQNAVRNFINTTLNQHEQQHVAAFNTYRGTVNTPFTFTGCTSDLQAHIQGIHDGIEVPRRAASDALSAALDANGANVFNITCECPDPQTDAGTN